MAETDTDIYRAGRPERADGAHHEALVIVMNGDELAMAPSRHSLAGVDVVHFARGPRAAIRDQRDGMSRLVIRIPDPLMSTDHGRLLRVQSRWMLDDPSSKNGALIAGHASRCGMIEPTDLFELGHTVFLFEKLPWSGELPSDITLDARDALASLHPDLLAAQGALAHVARSDLPVVLLGETGTGKEVYAQAIHARSGRKGPLIAVNCGALSASLLEAELFGHRKGAFSGATADRPGFIRSADGGTLFLDEIGELTTAGQVALLRVLQEGEVIPVGDSTPIGVDVRVVVASQRPLQDEVEAGRFRSDLYARMLGYEVKLPPLRERPFDIGALCYRLVSRLAPARKVTIAPAAARALITYEWPRNIRELERCLASAIVLARDRTIELEHLPESVQRATSGRVRTLPAHPPEPMPHDEPEDQLREQLAAKLVEHAGNITAVARDFGKHREQIHRWLKRFGFDPKAFRR